MQNVLALLLICALTVPSAFAGLNRNKARYVGGTTTIPPAKAVGILSATDEGHLTFNYEGGKAADKTKFPAGDFSLPYSEIMRSATVNTLACALDRRLHWQPWPEWVVFSFCFRKVKLTTLRLNTRTFR
jgi:hypothetical protein